MLEGFATTLKSVLPGVSRRRLGRVRRRWSIGGMEPINRCFGLDRGTPIDRYYIERFLDEHRVDVRGEVLEISDNTYTRRFGNGRVKRSHVLSIDPKNPDATIVVDLAGAGAGDLPSEAMDCIICTQTLQFIYDVRKAIAAMHRMLKPGGVLLISVPGICQIARYDMDHWGEHWRFTTMSLRRLLSELFPVDEVEVTAHGNVMVAAAFLYGLPAGDIRQHELDAHDRDYELLITARAVKRDRGGISGCQINGQMNGHTNGQIAAASPNTEGAAGEAEKTTIGGSRLPPTVSVVMPTHNRVGLLRRAIDSLRAQTFQDWECVIADDASSDGTAEYLAALCAEDPRFRVRLMPERGGNTRTRIAASNMARGEFLALLDDDDWWEPEKLARQVSLMQASPQAAWSYHAAQLVSPNGAGAMELVEHNSDFLRKLVQYNWLRHSSMMFRRSAFEAIGGYDPRLRLASDWDLVLRLTLRFGQHNIVTLPDLLVNYWMHQDNISSNGAVRALAERRIVRKTLLRERLITRRPGLALRMLDRQLDREMHWRLSQKQHVRAFATAALSAMARPLRGWRWTRAWRFLRTALTGKRPAHG